MSSPRSLILTLGLAAAALAPAASAQAATVLSSEPVPTHVAAWNGTVMWSQLDQATGNYRLVKSVNGGAPTPVAVPQRAGGPFDIDLGTNRSGATYAVYTRDGDIYRLSVATGAETKITKLSSPTLAERDPTIQRGEIGEAVRGALLDPASPAVHDAHGAPGRQERLQPLRFGGARHRNELGPVDGDLVRQPFDGSSGGQRDGAEAVGKRGDHVQSGAPDGPRGTEHGHFLHENRRL